MNWGWKITLVYSLFVVGILTLVFKARSEKVDLVATDYYAQELAFGKRIEAQRNAGELSERPVIRQDSYDLVLNCLLPANILPMGMSTSIVHPTLHSTNICH